MPNKDIARISRKLRYLGEPLSNQELEAIGSEVIVEIQTRTESGKDVNGARFKGYSDRTKKSRSKRGRTTSKVDLSDFGDMLRSMTSRVESNKVIIAFSKMVENDKAYFHQTGAGKLPVRRFFAISKKQTTRVVEMVREHYRKIINK